MWIGAAVQTKTNPATKQHDKQLLRVIMYKDTHKKHQTTNKQTNKSHYVGEQCPVDMGGSQTERENLKEKKHKKNNHSHYVKQQCPVGIESS